MDYAMNTNHDILTIKYRLLLNNKTEKIFNIRLNASTMDYVPTRAVHPPEWTKLTFQQCPNCQLDANIHSRCPVAMNALDAIEFFKPLESIEKLHLRIETDQRSYSRDTDMQTTVCSLLGIIMPTSGCPVLNKLRPMVRFHLPFATVDETQFRAISMYLLEQFLLARQNIQPDWELKSLLENYQEIELVNRAFMGRLRKLSVEDSTLNALIRLTTFEQYIHFCVTEQSLTELEQIFKPYLAA